MKIETTIPPRKDGTVIVEVCSTKYSFAPDAQGVLVAEIENEVHLAYLLKRGDDFLPADDADFDAAEDLIREKTAPAAGGPEGDGDDDDDDEQDQNAAPIEEPASDVAAAGEPKAAKVRKIKTKVAAG